MLKELPVFPFKLDKPLPMEWNDYAKATSVMFNLGLKWVIARNLLELTRLLSNPQECQTFARLWKNLERRNTVVRQQMFARQTLAVTMELTENLAAMCFAYAEALKCGARFLPLLLRDFGHLNRERAKRYSGSKINLSLGNSNKLFDDMLGSEGKLREYLACKGEPRAIVRRKRQVVSEIVKFRRKYDVWYNRFKHTNSVFVVEGLFDVPGTFSFLVRVPDDINWTDEKVTFRDERIFASITTDESRVAGTSVSHLQTENFLTAYQNMDDVGMILALLEKFWQPIRSAQHRVSSAKM